MVYTLDDHLVGHCREGELSTERQFKSVETYGRRYVQEYLAAARERHDAIKGDPLAALTFMHGKLFMRGRRDSVSVTFRDRTRNVLEQYKSIHDIDLTVLKSQLHASGVNNQHDRRMVAASIAFARTELDGFGCNVYVWAADAIRTGRSAAAFVKLDGIHAVGDKLAAFYLRDVAFLEDIEDSIGADDYRYFQPVDTWVERVTQSLGIITTSDAGMTYVVKRKIIAACQTASVSPLLFNAGAWMVGAHAYRMLIERL